MSKLLSVQLEEKTDILSLLYNNFKVSFSFSTFFRDIECYNSDHAHITSKFTKEQFVVTSEIKNKHLFYIFKSKNKEFGFFKYDLTNKLMKH